MKTTDRDEAWAIWLARLRQPNTPLFDGALADIDSEAKCCLGWCCDALDVPRLERPNLGEVLYGWEDSDEIAPDYSDFREDYLPASVARLLNVTPRCEFRKAIEVVDPKSREKLRIGQSELPKLFHSIALVNDTKRFTAAQIADILERERAAGNLRPYPDE